jgi:hypothetical protein
MADIKDALKKAQKDPAFARELATNPEKFRDKYNLNNEQIDKFKNVLKAAEGPTVGCYYGG